MISADVLQLIGDQRGVIARRQLLDDFGVNPTTLWRAVRDGRFVVMAPGVLRLRSSPDGFLARCQAATLLGRGVGFLSGFTAGRLHHLRRMHSDRIHFTVPRDFRHEAPDWMTLHHSQWYSGITDRITTADGLVVATPERMLWGMAAEFNQYRFDRAADDAWYRGLIVPETMADYLELHRCRGKDGVTRLERWLERALVQSRPSHSDLERRIIDALERIGLPSPVRQVPVTLLGGERIHLDAGWPELRLAVEPGHSWFHRFDGGQERDHLRDAACAEVGWQVIRLNERMLERPDLCARSIAVAYRQRRRDILRLGP